MIIIDFSGVLQASAYSLIKMNDGEFSPLLYKHLVLNNILSYKKKFMSEYGKMVFAMDSRVGYWRKDDFPHYKYKRKENTAKAQAKQDKVNWKEVYDTMDEITNDMDVVFPYKVIKIDNCEADDIIGTLAERLTEPMMIVSRDGDFKQLQRYPHVKQWDPFTKKLIKEPNPLKYLKEHIIRGDSGDGIPNILSDNDSFYIGKKQSPIKKAWIAQVMKKDVRDFAETTKILDRYKENEKLIDLSKVPEKYKNLIMDKYYEPNNGHNKKIQSYLISNRLSNLLESVQYFVEKDDLQPKQKNQSSLMNLRS